MESKSSFYALLGLQKDASPEQVRRAYRSLARRWHPDKNPPSSKHEAEAKFAAIAQAYEALLGEPPRERRSAAALTGREPPRRHGPVVFVRKPPPIERKLECSLEELFRGCSKEVRYTRDAVGRNGIIYKKEEVQMVKVKPGLRKGHKITLENKGDERPGSVPSDVVLVVSEKEHPHFKRVHNDLVLKVEVPLVNALTGWTFTLRRLNGEKLKCSFEDEIVFPGYEKVIKGEGMPVAGQKGIRGDLRIKFSIVFPKSLSWEQKADVTALLKDCT